MFAIVYLEVQFWDINKPFKDILSGLINLGNTGLNKIKYALKNISVLLTTHISYESQTIFIFYHRPGVSK